MYLVVNEVLVQWVTFLLSIQELSRSPVIMTAIFSQIRLSGFFQCRNNSETENH